jgi:DNA-binding transcriptional ArsR family regulator
MDVEQLLTGTRWELLQRLAHEPQGTGEVATTMGMSPANASQQLRQLELAGLVRRRRTERRGAHYVYDIPTELLYLVHLAPTVAAKKTLSLDPLRRFMAGLLLQDNGLPVLALTLQKPQLFARFSAVGLLERESPEIFVITEEVEQVRREHANPVVQSPEGEARIIIWSHTLQEVKDGVAREEPYFTKALKEISLLYDPQKSLLNQIRRLEEMG